MTWRTVVGWLLMFCGVAGTLCALWGAYSVYVLRSLLPFTEWDPVGVIGRITAVLAVSVVALAVGIRLVRKSRQA